MRLSDAINRLETILRKNGNLKLYGVNSEGEIDNFSFAGFSDSEDGHCVLIIANSDRSKEVTNDQVEAD